MTDINPLDYKELAIKFVKKYRRKDPEDGIQDAYVSILNNKLNFDSKRNVKFLTYAYKSIMGYVMYNMDNFYYTSLSEHVIDKYNIENHTFFTKIDFLSEREKEILINLSIHNLGLPELSKRYNISTQRVDQIYKNALKKCRNYIQL